MCIYFALRVFKRSFLGEFSKKMAANTLVVCVRCVRVTVFYTRADKRASHRTDFCDISYLGFLLKFVDIFQFWLKSDKINKFLHENVPTFMTLISKICTCQVRQEA